MSPVAKNIKSLIELDPSAIIALYQINLKEGKGKYFFHAGENGYKQKVVFNGVEYDFFPLKAEGFELKGDGTLPRPTLTMSNHQGVISLRLNYFDDFINYKVTRIKTFVKYLDNVNFPNNINPHAEPDPSAAFAEDAYYINQKTKEDDNIVEFELVSILELQNANIPGRIVYSNTCTWNYRSSIGCGYVGKPIADSKNKRFVASGYAGIYKGDELGYGGIGADVYFPTGNAVARDQEFAATGSLALGAYSGWNPLSQYTTGDVVALEPFESTSELNPAGIYVCLGTGIKSSPLYDTQNWRLDECDHSLAGCRLRFGDAASGAGGCRRTLSYGEDGIWNESEEGLPFGGFPGVDPYKYE